MQLTFSNNTRTILIVVRFGLWIRVDAPVNWVTIWDCWWLLALVVRLASGTLACVSSSFVVALPLRCRAFSYRLCRPVNTAALHDDQFDQIDCRALDLVRLQWLKWLQLGHHLVELILLWWPQFYPIHPLQLYLCFLFEEVCIKFCIGIIWFNFEFSFKLTLVSRIHASSGTATCMLCLGIRCIRCINGICRWTMLFEWFRHLKEIFFRLCHRQIR